MSKKLSVKNTQIAGTSLGSRTVEIDDSSRARQQFVRCLEQDVDASTTEKPGASAKEVVIKISFNNRTVNGEEIKTPDAYNLEVPDDIEAMMLLHQAMTQSKETFALCGEASNDNRSKVAEEALQYFYQPSVRARLKGEKNLQWLYVASSGNDSSSKGGNNGRSVAGASIPPSSEESTVAERVRVDADQTPQTLPAVQSAPTTTPDDDLTVEDVPKNAEEQCPNAFIRYARCVVENESQAVLYCRFTALRDGIPIPLADLSGELSIVSEKIRDKTASTKEAILYELCRRNELLYDQFAKAWSERETLEGKLGINTDQKRKRGQEIEQKELKKNEWYIGCLQLQSDIEDFEKSGKIVGSKEEIAEFKSRLEELKGREIKGGYYVASENLGEKLEKLEKSIDNSGNSSTVTVMEPLQTISGASGAPVVIGDEEEVKQEIARVKAANVELALELAKVNAELEELRQQLADRQAGPGGSGGSDGVNPGGGAGGGLPEWYDPAKHVIDLKERCELLEQANKNLLAVKDRFDAAGRVLLGRVQVLEEENKALRAKVEETGKESSDVAKHTDEILKSVRALPKIESQTIRTDVLYDTDAFSGPAPVADDSED